MISVIIPLYNKAHTIKRTLSSAINQSFQDFEIVIINDGSTDNSLQAIAEYFDDKRVKIINQENKGVSSARNKGVEESKYDHIAFLDGDDEWDQDYLKTISYIIGSFQNYGMINTAGFFKNNNTKNKKPRIANKYHNKIIEIDFFENPHVFVHTSATVIHKKYFQKVGGFDVNMKKNEDFKLFFSIALISQVIYCGIPLTYYSIEVENQSTTVNRKSRITSELDVCNRFNSTFRLWEKINRKNKTYKIFTKYEIRHIILRAIKKGDLELIDLYFKNLDKRVLQLFPSIEIMLYRTNYLHSISIVIIMITKLLWRLRGYPRVG